MAETTRVNVPETHGREITVSYNGDEPLTYRVTDGHVTVDNQHLPHFLAVVDGSTVATSGATKGA